MKIYITKDYDELSRKAALIIQAQILQKPESVLGLATGSSPLGIYGFLTGWAQSGDLDFSQVRTVNLDEYYGLSGDDSQSYRRFMQTNLFSKVNIKPENTYIPNGLEKDDIQECARYEKLIYSLGGIDLQLLGIGNNGHIGFNEPSDEFTAETHKQPLTQSTIDANKRFFAREEDVPRFAYTMGIGTIMRSKKILLIASGKTKAEAVKLMISGPITPRNPASVLRLHGDVVVIADAEAGALLK
ncbi:MAG: glucosamine-6-phosphate deaminase [Spirochaetaceae bacterium]|jgi:glucosamine-6-phosphate deaminase|nr:glucosamine-6-phosphate deaminase [Spirochaetaceae bacterium]